MTVCLLHLLFYLLLVLLMCGMLCDRVCANNSGESLPLSEDIVTIFKKGENGKVLKFPDGKEDTAVTAKEFYSPVLISAGDIMVALTGATKENDDKSITVLTNYTDTKDKELWKENVVKSGSWKQTIGIQKEVTSSGDNSIVKSFLAAANQNKIYVLLATCTNKNGAPTEPTCNFEIIVGTIDSDGQQDIKISWVKLEPSPNSNTYEVKISSEANLQGKYSIFGNAFSTKKGIIFVVKAKTTNDKIISLFVLSKINESTPEVLQIKDISEKCSQNIFLWNEKIIKLTTNCDGGDSVTIDAFNDINSEWNTVQKPLLFPLVNFLNDKKDFITEIINDREFIFFTQDFKPSSPGGKSNKYLWISDGTRAKNIGEITIDSKSTTPNSFFIIKEELFLLIQKYEGDKVVSISLKHLKEHTEKIKEVLLAWNTEKNKISQLCKDSVPSKVYCHTDGLVGFLFKNLSESKSNWKDEYYYKDATVTGGENTPNGITFMGKNGAKWSVKDTEGEQQQPYNFIHSGFTLVTTVQVDKVNSEYNSILGIDFAEKENSINLLCSNERRWVVRRGESEAKIETTNQNCKNGNTYQVVLIFNKGTKLKVYINGNYIDNLKTEILQIEKPDDIKYFYFGVDNEQKNDETHVTIQNVLLYNHPFSEDEINYLKVIEEIKPAGAGQEKDGDSAAKQQNSGGDNSEITKDVMGGDDELTPATVTGELVQSSTQQRESAVGNNVNVNLGVYGILLILMLCATKEYSLQF